MGVFIYKLRQYHVRYSPILYPFVFVLEWLVGEKLSEWTEKTNAGSHEMLEILTSVYEWLGYLTHPYVVIFFIGGFVFSFPEWWPWFKRSVIRNRDLFIRQKQSRSDKHNISLLEAIHYVAFNKWNNVRKMIDSGEVKLTDDEIDKLSFAFNEVKQWALDGDIRIWGENDREEWVEIIDITYWQRHWLDWKQIMRGKKENDWSLDDILGAGDDYYKARSDDLYHVYNTSKQDIEKLWQ